MGSGPAAVPVLVSACQSDCSATALVERIPAREVAKILGVKVATLAKWRQLGKGPKGWIYLSETLVVYPVSEIEHFLKEREGSVPANKRGGDKE
jgi:transposase-like protein